MSNHHLPDVRYKPIHIFFINTNYPLSNYNVNFLDQGTGTRVGSLRGPAAVFSGQLLVSPERSLLGSPASKHVFPPKCVRDPTPRSLGNLTQSAMPCL